MANTVLIVTVVVFSLVLILGITGLILYLVLSKKAPPNVTNLTNSLPPVTPVIPVIPVMPVTPNPTGATNPTGVTPAPTGPTGITPIPIPPAPTLPQGPIGPPSTTIFYWISGSATAYTTVGGRKVFVYPFTNKQIYNFKRSLYLVIEGGVCTYSKYRFSSGWNYDGVYTSSGVYTSGSGTDIGLGYIPYSGVEYYYVGNSARTKTYCDGWRIWLCLAITSKDGNDYIRQQPPLSMQGVKQIDDINRVGWMADDFATLGQPVTEDSDLWVVID